ncbi:DeoR family transcriptional regulator [Patescibacteria group bacterium]|nr:DeoR family transcriptional regulator [Patescibacteria group bacterium]
MDKKFLIQLTSSLYRLTLLFPKKEPLRYKMRELTVEILEDFVELENSNQSAKISHEILKNIKVLDNFFEVAKNQNWVGFSELFQIQKEYSNIQGTLEDLYKVGKIQQSEDNVFPAAERLKNQVSVRRELNGRQEKILEILKEKGRAQVWELNKIFPELSKRTLRRDVEQLYKEGLIERKGEKNTTFYELRIELVV